jgi:gliding motility-associated-like protein
LNAKVYIAIVSLLFIFQLKAQQDVGVSNMIAPLSGCSVGTASTNINVIVRNYSLSSAFPNTITVKYRINSGPITSELVGSILGPNASFNFTFLQPANLSACGNYQIKVWTQKTGDVNPLNDTLNYLFINDCTPIPGIIAGPSLLCDNVNADSLVVNGGTFSYGYQWFQQIVPAAFAASGNTSNKFYLNNLGDSSTYYIRYEGGFCPGINTPLFGIGISPTIITGVVSPDLVLCADNVTGNISVSTYTAVIDNWEQSNNGGFTWNPLGIASSTININYLTNSALFRSSIKSGVCGTQYSDTISVTVEPLIIPGTISGATNVCSGFSATNLTLSGQANHFGYEWYSSTDNVTFTPTGLTTSVNYVSNITQTTYYKVVFFGNTCANAETPVVALIVDPPVNGGTVSPNFFLCASNITGTVSVSGYTDTLLYWEQSNNNGTTWFSTGVSADIYDISYITATARFRAAIQSGICAIDYSSEIIVNVEPLVIPGNIVGATTVCGTSNLDTLSLVGFNNTASLFWYYSYDSVTTISANITNDTLITSNINQTAYFFVILTNAYCPSDTTAVITIQVDPYLNLGVPSSDLLLCENNVAGTVSISGFSSTISDWEQSNDGGATWFSTSDNSIAHDISYLIADANFRALIESGLCGSGYSDTISVTIDPVIIPGVITTGGDVCATSNTYTLILTGNTNDFGYQWYSSTDNINFIPTGITDDTLTVNNLTQTTYFKVILAGNGCPDDETNIATVTVNFPLNLGVTSTDLTLCSTNTVGGVSLTGYATSLIDWEQSNDGGLSWFSTGDNSQTHDISSLTASAQFRAVVDAGACGSGISDTISVVIESPIISGIITGSTAVCSGANMNTLVLTGNSNDFGFAWYSATLNTSYFPAGSSNDTIIISNLTETTYFKIILNGNSCVDVETTIFTVQVDQPLQLGITSADIALCSSNIIGSVSLSGYATNLVDWEQSNDGGTTWFLTGNNSASHDISYLTSSAQFRAIIDAGACGSGISNTILVEIEDPIIPGVILGNTVGCTGANNDTLVLSGHANDFGFQWYSATLNTSYFPTGITNDTIIISNLTQDTYFKVILNGNNCSDDETAIFTVIMNPNLNLGTTSPDLALCSSNIVGSVSLSGFSTTLLDWEQSNDGGATWFSTGDNSSSHNISSLTTSAEFRAIVDAGACGSGISDTISVIIQNPIVPGLITGDTIVCSSYNTDTLILMGNSNDFGFEWYYATLNTSYFPTGVFNDTIIISGVPVTTYYKVLLNGLNCPDNETLIFTIQVDPPLQLGITSADLNFCSNNIVGPVSLSGFTSILVDWEQSDDGGTTWFSTGDNSSTHDISSLSASAFFRALVESGTCGSGYSDTISVTIDPLGLPASIGFNFSACVGSSDLDSMKVLNHTGSILYWQYSTDNGVNWSPTANSDSIYYANYLQQTTIYQLITSHGPCPNAVSNNVTAIVYPLPTVSAGQDTVILLGTATQLFGSGGSFGIWTPNSYLSDPSLPSPNCYTQQTTNYAYTVIDANGCTNTDYVQISVVDDTAGLTFIIYNIITPNGDGKNDFFTITGLNTIDKYLIKIFNANGNLIFSSSDYTNDWGATHKGEIVPDGTYLYAVEIDDITKYRGFLTIMKGND